jgi:pyruvate/2-oxoglutarate/acetoin dehydrogenase E1 component
MNNKKYQENLTKAMSMLGKEKKTIFIGQTIVYGGSPMFGTCESVPKEKKIEMPVFEDTQMGLSIGLALEGFIPISIFPRIDFLICATNQLVNHLDKVEIMSKGEFTPGVIIRTQIGNTKPLYPGCQHCGDYYQGLKKMLKVVLVIKIKNEKEVIPAYKLALKRAKRGSSTLLVEVPTGAFKK